jgi:hypothetical protein
MERQNPQEPVEPQRFLTVAQLAQRYAVSPRTVYRNCSPNNPAPWPSSRVGSGPRAPIRFSPQQVEEIDLLLSVRAPEPSADVRLLRRQALGMKKLRKIAASGGPDMPSSTPYT